MNQIAITVRSSPNLADYFNPDESCQKSFRHGANLCLTGSASSRRSNDESNLY